MFQQKELVNNIERLRRFAIRLTRNLDDADDLVQATTLRALEKKHLFQEGTNLLSWESSIMFNLFITEYRRKTKFESKYAPDHVIENYSMEPLQERDFHLSCVRKAIKYLSPEHQRILTLACIEERKYEEVSCHLSIPIGTVRSRVARARENLRFILENNDNMVTRKKAQR